MFVQNREWMRRLWLSVSSAGWVSVLAMLFKEELLVRDIIDWGFGEERVEYPHTLPRFICAECKLAMQQRKKVEKR